MKALYERLVIGALIAGQINEYESDLLLNMKGEPDMLEPFNGLIAALQREAFAKRLQKGAELIESATEPTELIKYKRLYDAIEKKYYEVDLQCKNYGL